MDDRLLWGIVFVMSAVAIVVWFVRFVDQSLDSAKARRDARDRNPSVRPGGTLRQLACVLVGHKERGICPRCERRTG